MSETRTVRISDQHEAAERIEQLEAALKFYADEWLKDDGLPFEPTDALWDDKGETARKALNR